MKKAHKKIHEGLKGNEPYQAEYAIQSRRVASDENDEIMESAIGKIGHVKLRINPQIYDSVNTRYVGLIGQQFRLNVYNSAEVLKLMDAIDALIEAGTVVPMEELIVLIQGFAGTAKAK